MPKKNSDVITRRAWNMLRLALLWARKGGVFKRRLMMELRLAAAKFVTSIGHVTRRDQIYYGERQLSFDETPVFHVKMHRPASMRRLIPCITPKEVDFDSDFDECDDDYYDNGRKSFFLKDNKEEEEEEEEEVLPEEEQGIDSRAEEFIAKFYQQMKMQRQISYLEYNGEAKQ